MDRRWPAWAALWSTWAIATMWVVCLSPALEILERPVATPSTESAGRGVALAVLVLGAVLAACYVGVAASWARWPRVGRAGLAVAGVALLASAAVWPGVPDTGPLYVAGTVLAGVVALAAAALPSLQPTAQPTAEPSAPPAGTVRGEPTEPAYAAAAPSRTGSAWLARVALLLGGAVVVAGGLRGLAYWQWRISSGQVHYLVAVVIGVAMLLLALAGPRLAAWERGLRWVVVAVLLPLALLSLVAGLEMLLETSTLRVPEEAEVGWGIGTPLLLLGSGLLAGAVAARRCCWQLAALSVSSATLVCVLAVVRESTIQHLV